MWIKNGEGDYYNLERCREIYIDGKGNTHFCLDGCNIIAEGDIRDVVIKNIISGTKVMEVE